MKSPKIPVMKTNLLIAIALLILCPPCFSESVEAPALQTLHRELSEVDPDLLKWAHDAPALRRTHKPADRQNIANSSDPVNSDRVYLRKQRIDKVLRGAGKVARVTLLAAGAACAGAAQAVASQPVQPIYTPTSVPAYAPTFTQRKPVDSGIHGYAINRLGGNMVTLQQLY